MQPTTPRPPPRRSHRAQNVAIVLALFFIVLPVIAFVAVEHRSSDVDVTVISDHATNAVTYAFTVDGRQVGSGALSPGQKTFYRLPFSWWFYPCQPHSFSASSTGGELGPRNDWLNLTVCAGTSYGYALSV